MLTEYSERKMLGPGAHSWARGREGVNLQIQSRNRYN